MVAYGEDVRGRYRSLRATGLSQGAAARVVGITRQTGVNWERDPGFLSMGNRRIGSGGHGSARGNGGRIPARSGNGNPWGDGHTDESPDPVALSDLGPEARASLSDFGLFRRRYLGRGSIPWQTDAAHRVLDLLEDARRRKDREYLVLNAPPSAGKSTLWHDVCVWLICRDRRVRILYGSRTTGQAMKYTRRIRRSLSQRGIVVPREEELRAGLATMPVAALVDDFGRFKPLGKTDGDVWQQGGFTVAQLENYFTDEKEPTVTAFGFDADYMGMRVDLAVWDDLVDPANVRTVEIIEKLQEDWDNVAEPRVDPGGVCVLQGQRIRHNDLYRYCLDKRRARDEEDDEDEAPAVDDDFVAKYHHVVYQAHDESRCRELHKRSDPPQDPRLPADDPRTGCLLDPRRLPWRDLKTLQAESPETYRVVYQQEDLDPDSSLIQKVYVDGGKDPATGTLHVGCWDHERSMWKPPPASAVPAPNHVALIADPSPSNWWAVQLWLYNPASERRYLIALDRRRMTAPEFLEWDADRARFTGFLEEWWLRATDCGIPFRHMVLEVNAAQKWLLQYDHAKRWAQKRGVTFVPHTTGVLKTDQERGIWALKPHWRTGRIRLPGAPDGSKTQSMLLVNEMLRWPHGMTDDQVMAHWFFEFTLPRLSPPRRSSQPRQWRPSWLGSATGAREALVR